MPSDNDPAIGPPPLRTPFHEIPRTVPSATLPTAEKIEQGNISRPWTNWLQQVYSAVLAGGGGGGGGGDFTVDITQEDEPVEY